jgi:hypothetical protein
MTAAGHTNVLMVKIPIPVEILYEYCPGEVKTANAGPDPRVRADPAAEEAFQPLKKQDFVHEARCGRAQASLEASIASR